MGIGKKVWKSVTESVMQLFNSMGSKLIHLKLDQGGFFTVMKVLDQVMLTTKSLHTFLVFCCFVI